MKLSEAIREGSRLAPQAFGAMNKGGGTCALGGAVEHLAMRGEVSMIPPDGTWTTDPLEKRFPVMAALVEAPCGCAEVKGWDHSCSSRYDGSVMLTIIHLNDRHAWTREAIAEWVEVIEKKLETPVVQTVGSSDSPKAKCLAVGMGSTPTLATISQ